MYPSVTYFYSAFVAVVYVCLTRELEAISDLSAGMRVRVRDGDACGVCDYEACLTRVLEAMSDLSAGIHVKVRDCDRCQFVTVLDAVLKIRSMSYESIRGDYELERGNACKSS